MISVPRLKYGWRVSRYSAELRARDSPWESWTSISDVGQPFNGIELTREEYLRVEDAYIDIVAGFLVDAGADFFDVVYVAHQEAGFELSEGQRLPRSDIAPLVRGNLRGTLDCALQSPAADLQVEFGYDLYLRIGAERSCQRAVARATRLGLYVESGVGLVLWDENE